MNLVLLFLIALFIAPGVFIVRFIINVRKRLINAEESKRCLKEDLESKLRAEERKRQDLEGGLFKAKEELNRLEEELKLKVEEELRKNRIQEEERRRQEVEQRQFEEKLLQVEEEKKYLIDALQKAKMQHDRIEEERRKLQEEKQRLEAERELRDKAEKEMTARLETQSRELDEIIHKIEEKLNRFEEIIRQKVKDEEDLRQKNLEEEQIWKSEIEARDKTQRELMEKFDAERRNFEEKLLKADAELKRLEEEIKEKIKREEERRRQQAEEEQRRWAEQEKQNKDQLTIIEQLKNERQQLKERLSKADEERKCLEEELKRTAEEVRGRVEIEKLERLEVERKQLEERLSKSDKKRRGLIKKLKEIKPNVRGGRPRGPGGMGGNDPREQGTHSLKPEIICWKEGWSWIIGIEVPEGLETQSIFQDGIQLEYDKANENRYPLKQPESRVKITWSEGSELIPLLRPERDYIIFKMRNNWKGPGRLVRYCTAGYYLIIAPQDWERDIEISGSASVAPESTQFGGFKAHFFYQEKTENAAIGLITMDGKRVRVDSKSPRFKLVGNEISDASEDKGPLFAEQPPLIQALNGIKGWSDVEIIVVGEEGSGRNKWRDSFAPNVSVEEQTNLDMLINGRSGWYFLRIYDKNNDLIESMDFRFFRNLRNIQIEGNTSCLPGPAGHENIIVKFLHHPDCKVVLRDRDIQHLLDISREIGETTITLPPESNCDKTDWILSDDGAEVDVTILTERIWWSFGTLEEVPIIWADKPIPLSRRDFTAITNKALWVRLPRPRFARKINGGFDPTKRRFYQVEVGKKEVAIPLRDFCDCEEIQNPMQEYLFHLFIDSPDRSYSAPVLNIITTFRCKSCQFITTSEEEALSHINVHLFDLIPHLSYEELCRRLRLVLPKKIYKCSYCGFYVKTDDLENPTSKICSHIERNCPKALRIHGSPEIYFSIVSDIDEIRENVIPNLPHIYQCRICTKEFQGDNRELRLIHLQNNHLREFFQLF
jgi:hypothetical protein